TLLDKSPYWGVADVASLQERSYEGTLDPIKYILAASLASTGRKDAALRIIETVLEENPGYDPAYALYIDLKGPTAMAKLDQLAARNRFQERPLIWKAKMLYDQGKLEEAESVARKAISIDPSDGETTGGHRMFGYAVLANIREARGDKSEAALFRSAVRAIRMSEEADKILAA